MEIEYLFEFDDEAPLHYQIDIDRKEPLIAAEPTEWTALEFNQCGNCPLSKEESSCCPAARDLQSIVVDFCGRPSMQKARVRVTTPEREYEKVTGLEEGVRSLMGVIMASSSCPILRQLKPLAHHHLPFASAEEFMLRSVSTYLLEQLFEHRDGRDADWSLSGLIARHEQLQLVNQALWHRVYGACSGESNHKALLSFFALTSKVSGSLDQQIEQLRKAFV